MHTCMGRSSSARVITLELLRRSEAQPEKGLVAALHFRICDAKSGAVVGVCDLRTGHNQNTRYGGNVGYSVFPDYRGEGIAARAVRLLFDYARAEKMTELYITCAPENIASQKTCENAGLSFVDELDLPVWHEMYRNGRRKTRRYRIDLSRAE